MQNFDKSVIKLRHGEMESNSFEGDAMFRKRRVLLLIETSTSYGRDLLEGISRYTKERNEWSFSIIPRGITESPEYLKNWRGDGLITRTPNDRMYRLIQKFHCPTVELMYIAKPDVFCDETALVNLALDHFEEHLFERVAFFSFGGTGWIAERRRCFLAECRRRGIESFCYSPGLSGRDLTREPLWKENMTNRSNNGSTRFRNRSRF